MPLPHNAALSALAAPAHRLVSLSRAPSFAPTSPAAPISSDALNDVYFNSNIDLNPKFSPMLTVPVMDHLGDVVAVMQLRTGDARNFVSADSTQILTLCTRQISYVLGHHHAMEESAKCLTCGESFS